MMIDVERRLDSHHAALVAGFATDAVQMAAASSAGVLQPTATRRPPRTRLMGALAVAVAATLAAMVVPWLVPGSNATLTIQAPGLTIVADAASRVTPRLTASQAQAAALAMLAHDAGQPHLSGYTVTTTTFAPGVHRVAQQCGANIAIPTNHNLWVVALTAPPQSQWTFIRAALLVDDDSGGVIGGQILVSRNAPAGQFGSCHWGT